MIQDFLARHVAGSVWPIITLIVSLLCFGGLLIWTLRGGRDRFRHEAALPLDDETPLDLHQPND